MELMKGFVALRVHDVRLKWRRPQRRLLRQRGLVVPHLSYVFSCVRRDHRCGCGGGGNGSSGGGGGVNRCCYIPGALLGLALLPRDLGAFRFELFLEAVPGGCAGGCRHLAIQRDSEIITNNATDSENRSGDMQVSKDCFHAPLLQDT